MTTMAIISINGEEYDTDNMTEESKAQLQSLQFTVAEINRLKLQIAAMQTAQHAYGIRLKELLIDTGEAETDGQIDIPDNLVFD